MRKVRSFHRYFLYPTFDSTAEQPKASKKDFIDGRSLLAESLGSLSARYFAEFEGHCSRLNY